MANKSKQILHISKVLMIHYLLHYGIAPIETRRPKKVGYPSCFACPQRLLHVAVPFETQRENAQEYLAIVCQRQKKLNRGNEQRY